MGNPKSRQEILANIAWRCIGPHRGGRVVAVTGDPIHPMVFYFGACAGGVWKTTDGGTYWENISDGYFKTASIGAITLSETDPNVIYVGTGESCIRGDVSAGDGVYKSTDGGRTWSHMGLEDTRHISRIRVHPRNPDIVYVAALGHAYGPNTQRGIFRSTDGGSTWEKILYKSDRAGAIDLSMDPNNPRVLYAAVWQVLRKPWMFSSGGPDSGLFKSNDSGDTWKELTDNPGMPDGTKGRIGISASAARNGRVWAIVEAQDRGIYRSEDGGGNWEKVSDDAAQFQRPWYYSHIFADPINPDTVYVLNLKTWKSTDAGHTFREITMPHGDNHDLWIDANDSQRMIEGNDGGACVSFNGGDTWSTIYNQPTSQFYHIITDDQFPYRVYGTQQDNTAISVPSRSYKGGIPSEEAYTVGHSESGYIAVDPSDPNIVFSGAIGSAPGGGDSLLKYDHRSGQSQIVSIWPEVMLGWGPKHYRYRFQWTYPLFFSSHDPHTLYSAGNMVFRSEDGGMSWDTISPDLTRADQSKMEASGGPVTLDTSGVEVFGTIFSLVESPHERGVFWTGSDDGLVHLSQDDGKTWTDVTPHSLPEWSLITSIEPSQHDPDTVYLSATRYRLHDNSPYIFQTKDKGKTWRFISNDLPDEQFVRVVREDPVSSRLLYIGTEVGVYFSSDYGLSWQPLRGNLPVVPVHDISVKGNELVAGTHGRSLWILDNLTLLRQLTEIDNHPTVHLFKPCDTFRVSSWAEMGRKPLAGKVYVLPSGDPATYYEDRGPLGDTRRRFLDAGANPPNGVLINYYLKYKPADDLTLTISDSSGLAIATYNSQNNKGGDDTSTCISLPAEAGMNSVVWDMHYPPSNVIVDEDPEDNQIRPLAPPGSYSVTLSSQNSTMEHVFALLKDPRVTATQKDFEEQFSLLIKIRDKLSELHNAVSRIRSIRSQVDIWVTRAKEESRQTELMEMSCPLKETLDAIEEELVQTESRTNMDWLHLPTRLETKLLAIATVVGGADSAPTKQSYQVFHQLCELIDIQMNALQELVATELPRFSTLLQDQRIPLISTKLVP